MVNPEGAAAVTFDASTQTFTFGQVTDLSLAGNNIGTLYSVVVTAQVGLVSLVETTVSFSLRLRNPCTDPAYVTILTKPLPDQTYGLYTYNPVGFQWNYEPFVA